MNLDLLYFVAKVTMLLTATAYNFETKGDITANVISALVLSCLIVFNFISTKIKILEKVKIICGIVIVMACVYFGLDKYFSIAFFSIIQLLDGKNKSMFWQVSAVILALGMIIIPMNFFNVIVMIISCVFFIFARITILQFEVLKNNNNEQRSELLDNRNRIQDMKNYIKNLRQTVSMEERNRFSARIHDQLGHSISGSIILLEATKLNVEKNPQKAVENIDIVTENLRKGVDDIRKSLRDERPERLQLGVSTIKSILEKFSLSHSINTDVKLSGNLEGVQPHIWVCIKENLTEALTNILKHSKAKNFVVSIQVYNKIIRVEYKDDGGANGNLIKGLGLESIEERTALCGGKTLIRQANNSFSIINIYKY